MKTKFRISYENGEVNSFSIEDTPMDTGRTHYVGDTTNEQGQVFHEGLTVIDNGDCLRIPSTSGADDIVIDYGTAELLMAVIYHNYTTVQGVKLDKMERG